MRGLAPVLIGGAWKSSFGSAWIHAQNPATGAVLGSYPVSPWEEIDQALDAGAAAYHILQETGPEPLSRFLEGFAVRIEAAASQLGAIAHAETALPTSPRLVDVELPRTADQLRQAAAAARSRSWREPLLSPAHRIASYLAPIPGVVVVLGPNNFPFAFSSASGGDFAAAVATGHPVLAKANPGHPETTRLLAEQAHDASAEFGLPAAAIQLIYNTDPDDGLRMVSDQRVAATAFTGSRQSGMTLKRAADEAGRPIYLEMSSVNPVVVLPGAWRQRGEALADELAASMLTGTGQFCTSPGLVFVMKEQVAEGLENALAAALQRIGGGTLLGEGVRRGLSEAVALLKGAGAEVVFQGDEAGPGCMFPTTLLRVSGSRFLEEPEALQTEAFGNVAMVVIADDIEELRRCLSVLEGNLTGSIYTGFDTSDDDAYAVLSPYLRQRVGRLLNDKVPTGVAVVPSMNHGGPFPSTGHPGFTAVGIPASLRRFAMLQCFDNVRDERLPPELQAGNPLGLQRLVDGHWTDAPVEWG